MIGVAAAAVIYLGWWLALGARVELVPDGPAFWLGILVFAGAVIVHESIHYVLLPAGDRAFDIKGGAVRVVFDADLTPTRGRVVAIAPFVVLTLAPLAFVLAGGDVAYWFAFASIWNALCSGSDLITFWRAGRDDPRAAPSG